MDYFESEDKVCEEIGRKFNLPLQAPVAQAVVIQEVESDENALAFFQHCDELIEEFEKTLP